ncbi:PilN domain-containing protein [Clostridium oryzae]|uniref:Fimbrial assembly protein PilN n=1 Tax=Clostridium oryzae TaxID=1450648 RepID=A0A1V4IPX3_9CLOT|nr:PilN domain-containing protein [Clostridium oryzae]OPJ61517.1 fimbrial assembly protein PilN [Clostridium oryzae]
MNDLNFFTSYNEAAKESKNTRYIIITAAGIIGTLILLSNIWYIINSVMLNINISKINTQINASDIQKEYSQVQELKKKQDILKKYFQTSSSIVNAVDNKNKVTTKLINEINSCMPLDVYMSNISINEDIIQLNCSAKSMITAAQFGHNITELANMESANFADINYDTSKKRYNFSLKCSFKDVVQDEDK